MSSPRLRRVLKVLGLLLVALIVIVAAVATWGWWQVGRSRAQLSGERVLPGLSADVTVDRDDLGVPTVRATSREDLARALGFLHAQDRFFQMDLARRRAAGELSELIGRAALATDRSARLHRFRARAAGVLAHESETNRALVTAYSAGVNAGLDALGAVPFEYLALRQTPQPWAPEDSVLVIVSMFFSLQDARGLGEARAGVLAEALPRPLAEFLHSTASDWDTPELGDALPPPVPPGPEVFDLRSPGAATVSGRSPGASAPGTDTRAEALVLHQEAIVLHQEQLVLHQEQEADARGSNNWAVAGSRTGAGVAILANDMHLGLGVPNIWYRASLVHQIDGREWTVTGATLPGTPSMVVGSNGAIAWGFTNATADWTDRVLLEVDDDGPSSTYRTPDGPRRFDVFQEHIAISGDAPETIDVRETIWGPVDGPDAQGRLHAITWVAHHPEAVTLGFARMETATSLDEAIVIANTSGLPAQNVTMADALGNIAWTIGGRIPRREGFDGRYPASWADGTRRWNGWYSPESYPKIINPASGVIVTANNRIVSGEALAMLGDGGYDTGARARQIRNALLATTDADVAEMLLVQLDDRALLMESWRDLALSALSQATSTPERDEFRRLLQQVWSGRASPQSAAYRLVRQFRQKAAELAWAPFVERARVLDPVFPSTPGRTLEGPVWALLTTQPPHLLDPKYDTWTALMIDAIDQTVAELTTGGRALADRTWGEVNTLTAQHPLSRAVPQLSAWLDLPRAPLPGDSHMPRFQSATNGASERFAVSPGREAEGYFHMPGGQSGNPRSVHYTDGHEAWVKGTPTPFLPGPSVARLVLKRE